MTMNRRSFMKASGMAAALGVTGLAGCNGLLGGGGSGPTNWQYDPETLSSTQMRMFGSMQYGDLYEMRDELPGSMGSAFETESTSSVSQEDIDMFSGVAGGQLSMETQSGSFFGSMVITGSFDPDAIGQEMASSENTQESGEYEGYTLYEGANLDQELPGGSMPGQTPTDATATVAVSADAVVFGVTVDQGTDLGVNGQQSVEAMIDANSGSGTRLADANDHVRQFHSKLGGDTMVVGGDVDPELLEMAQEQSGAGMGSQMMNGLRAAGFSAGIDPSTTTYTFALIYESSQAAEDSGIVGLVNMMSQQASESEEINSIDANQDGSSIVVTVEGDTQALLSQGQNQVPMGSMSAGAIPGDV